MKVYQKAMLSTTFALGVAVAGFIHTAQAVPMLKLISGSSTVIISDEGSDDTNPGAPGTVGFDDAVGNFKINATIGYTKPELGSSAVPRMDLNSLNSTFLATSGGTLEIYFTDTDFTAPGPDGLQASIGGTTSGKVTYKTYRDLGNSPFGTSELLTDTGMMTGPAFASSGGSILSEPIAPYSLTMYVKIEHDGKNQATSFNAELVPQPEPATILFFGTGLLGLVGYAWRRQKQVA